MNFAKFAPSYQVLTVVSLFFRASHFTTSPLPRYFSHPKDSFASYPNFPMKLSNPFAVCYSESWRA